MKLTQAQLDMIADNLPEWYEHSRKYWLADNLPDAMADTLPEWMVEHRREWMVEHRREWMVEHHPDILQLLGDKEND